MLSCIPVLVTAFVALSPCGIVSMEVRDGGQSCEVYYDHGDAWSGQYRETVKIPCPQVIEQLRDKSK